MRSDFELDSDGWDLVITDDIGIVENAAMTSQDSKFSLQLIQGEVFDDTRLGVPWLTDMINPQVSIAARKQILRDTIMRTPGAVELTSLDVAVDNQTGIASCTFEGITDNGGIFGSSVGEVDIPSVTDSGIIAEYDYVTGKSFGLRLERSSEATYIKDGFLKYAGINIPRFEDSGLLLENSSTNYLLNSDNPALWGNSSLLSKTQRPDGNTQAMTGIFTASVGINRAANIITNTGAAILMNAGEKITCSCRVKSSYGRFRFRVQRSSGPEAANCVLDLTTGVLTQAPSFSIEARLGSDGYYYATATFTAPDDDSFVIQFRYIPAVGDSVIPQGSQISLQTPQVENNSASSFIVTSSVTSSRESDFISLTKSSPKWIYREYIPLGLISTVKELVEYDGTVSPYGHLQKLKVWNREPTASERAALGL